MCLAALGQLALTERTTQSETGFSISQDETRSSETSPSRAKPPLVSLDLANLQAACKPLVLSWKIEPLRVLTEAPSQLSASTVSTA
jgi:hypothetical protein